MQANNDLSCGSLSLLTPIGYQSGDCGYCKGDDSSRTPDSRASYYARSKSLCPRHYQELMDRGWRRSGSLLYLPDASRSCCPHYTIRLPAAGLKPIRDQRQAVHRWNRYVLGERYLKEVDMKYPKSKEEKKRQKNTFELSAVHDSEFTNTKPDIAPDHRFSVTLEPDTFTGEKFQLFDNYQRHVHHEGDAEISKSGFQRFLCSSPLHQHEVNGKKFGSFHQMYRLDGRLIAMSVLDLLPHAVSGVYFIYHSDFEKWSFGKISALREAALAVEGGYELLYMGYYIHTCKKMRYKGDYKTQHVLDYDTFKWDAMNEEMRQLMDKRKWVSMSRERRIRTELEEELGATKGGNGTVPDLDENEKADAAYAVGYPDPVDAMTSDLSTIQLRMPGVMDLDEMLARVNIDEMKATLGRGSVHEMQHLTPWHEGSMLDTRTIKGIVTEFAACVGPNVANEIVLDWRFG